MALTEASRRALVSGQGQESERYTWEGRFGPIVIEVRAGRAYVNGEVVEPAPPPDREQRERASSPTGGWAR